MTKTTYDKTDKTSFSYIRTLPFTIPYLQETVDSQYIQQQPSKPT